MRVWAVAEAIYGVIIGGLFVFFVPWKTPFVNVAFLAYAGLALAAGHGLWRGHRWGWRLGLAGGLVGLVAGLVVIAGLVSSWFYLHGTFGDFGHGASIASLLVISVPLQLLLLYPCLKLKGLLASPVRETFDAKGPWLRVILGLCLLPFLLGFAVHQRYVLTPLDPVPEAARVQAVEYVRARMMKREPPGLEALEGLAMGAGPLYVTIWYRGRIGYRVFGDGADLAEALTRATDNLVNHPQMQGRRESRGRIKIDRIAARAPVLSKAAPVLALSVNPGLDGLFLENGSTRRTILPEDLVRARWFGAQPLVPGIRELRLGLAAERALQRLDGAEGDLSRIRTESWIEGKTGVLPVMRGNTPGDSGPSAWRAAAISGGDFILRQLQPDGRFHYQYFPYLNRHPDPKRGVYSLPRHAGTVYSLALLYGLTGEARFKTGAEKAIAWLVERLPDACGAPERACVPKGDRADLGSTALTIVGMLEYQRRTGDPRYANDVRRLLRFVLALQRENGDFNHLFHLSTGEIDEETRLMFFSEEAALALVMGHKLLGDEAYLPAARRALDYLTTVKYDFFLGHFIYGADHWTCIAAEEAYPHLDDSRYLDFCRGYSRFIRRIQYQDGQWDNVDFRGHYGFSGLLVPQAPGAAGFTEAVVSTERLSRHHGIEDPALRVQIADALDALSREQVRAENAWMMPKPDAAKGGFRRSLVESEIRIDFTQHAASALIRGAVEADSDYVLPPGQSG